MSKLTRENAILPFTPAVDLTGNEGYVVQIESDGTISPFLSSSGKQPFGLIVHGTNVDEKTSVVPLSGGLAGTVKVKIASTIDNAGLLLGVRSGGDLIISTHASALFICAQALETGVAGEMIKAIQDAKTALIGTGGTATTAILDGVNAAVGILVGLATLVYLVIRIRKRLRSRHIPPILLLHLRQLNTLRHDPPERIRLLDALQIKIVLADHGLGVARLQRGITDRAEGPDRH